METKKSFEERVKDTVIEYARLYKDYFVDYDYLICSESFQKADYYIVQAHETNFKHLTGLSSPLSAKEFFDKCYAGTLDESDFSVTKKGIPDKNAKGTVRRKMKALPGMVGIFNAEAVVEEDYRHNSIRCSFVAEHQKTTIGFTQMNPAVPLTLLFGEKPDELRAGPMSLVLRKKAGETRFSEIVVGNREAMIERLESLEPLLDDKLLNSMGTNECG